MIKARHAMAIFLVRHGEYDFSDAGKEGGLTDEGRRNAERARSVLVAKGLGRGATILTSSARRAVETAEILSVAIGSGEVLSSDLINTAANRPELVRDLDQVIGKGLEEHGIADVPDELVVVGHMPLLSFIKFGDPFEGVPYGAIVNYEPGSWHNPLFSPQDPRTVDFEAANGLTR